MARDFGLLLVIGGLAAVALAAWCGALPVTDPHDRPELVLGPVGVVCILGGAIALALPARKGGD